MSARPRTALGAALAGIAALAACGPYPELAQKLDVTKPIAGGDTWIAVRGAERTTLRVLVLGPSGDGIPAAFSLTEMDMPISAGTTARAVQGEWLDGGAGASFTVRSAYLLPDERTVSLLARTGVTRTDADRTARVAIDRSGGALAITGPPELDGRYVRFREALAGLGASTPRDAACAFEIVNLAIRATEVRVIGFGGPGMTQYQSAETFAGTLGGAFTVAVRGFLENTTTIAFSAVVELGGTLLDGPQITDANSGGNGRMSGAVAFALEPLAADGSPLPAISGTVDFGGGGDPSDAIRISGGTATGGHYAIGLAGGATARVSPVAAPSPSVAECLSLP